tara:strand:+ start:341 stop:2473 length:2133 start_codon:yes stop_codon:yes gene_type:complete
MKLIDEILTEWAYRVHDGMPNPKNPIHLIELQNTLNELKLPTRVTEKLLQNLRELDFKNKAEFDAYNRKHKMRKTTKVKIGDKETTVGDAEGGDKGKKDDETSTGVSQEVSDMQDETSEKRDKGEAGAGGQAASQGESRYANGVDNLDYDEFKKENRENIDKKKEEFKSKKLSKKNKDDLEALGFEEPFSDEAYDYLATREVWAEQELQRMKEMEKPNVYTNSDGFGGSDKAYMEWMRAAFDGALATQELLEDSRMDTSKPKKTIQSTTEVDDKVEADLEKKANDPNLSEEDRAYYKKELKSFKKNRKYHDTYVVGVDEKGRTFIVSVSNKKDSYLRDPQNNTTPAARFKVIKERFGPKVAKRVSEAMDRAIKKVTGVQENTRKSSTKVEVDDDFVTLAEAVDPKRMKEVDKRATKTEKNKKSKYYGKAPRTGDGKPKKGSEFACYLEDKGISPDDYNKMSRKEKLQVMQEFMGDDGWHSENGTSVAYDPYSKIFIKVGEAMGGGRGFGKAFWDKNPEAAKARESNGAKQSEDIKKAEANAVNEAHQDVVNEITEADKEEGFPDENGNNGPHTKGYIDTVMEALHFNAYIDMEDDEDDKMIIQMGIKGAKPSHIRKCLAEKSGYDGPDPSTPEGKKALKEHLQNKCKVEVDPETGKATGAIVITGPDGDTKIANDTWRTAGTSQKVASGYGDDMRDCISAEVKKNRTGKK